LALNLFDQFVCPVFAGIPLIAIALLVPLTLFLPSQPQWVKPRSIVIQELATNRFARQLFMPINTAGHKWALMLTSLMVVLVLSNLLGLIPYTFTPTTQIALNMAFAASLWLMTVLVGFRTQPATALGHLLPEGTPGPLVPVLIMIETISLFIRPVALGVRLTANLTAGHLLMHLIANTSFVLLHSSAVLSALTTAVLLVLAVLELAVAMIQAYVFVLLISLYLQENT
uniref:ATP synthase F0 subunit 6 n=1 Tax=Eviota epiphanes TaxID=1248218 RepID=UPI0028FC7B02